MYYKLSFNNCNNIDYAFTVVPLDQITEYVNTIEWNQEGHKPMLVITHLNWTDEQFTDWFEKNVKTLTK